jgi:hypothetical protein
MATRVGAIVNGAVSPRASVGKNRGEQAGEPDA